VPVLEFPHGQKPHDTLLIAQHSKRVNAQRIADVAPAQIKLEESPVAGHGVEPLPCGGAQDGARLAPGAPFG
jgi:hypothetical protein